MATRGRRRARELAVVALYQADVLEQEVGERLSAIAAEEEIDAEVLAFARQLVDAVSIHRSAVDRALREASTRWDLERMPATDRAIMRMAAAELMLIPGVPAAVSIDEAIELAKEYGDDEAGRFVNGVLDAIRRRMEATRETDETVSLEPAPKDDA